MDAMKRTSSKSWLERGRSRWLLAFLIVLLVHALPALWFWKWPVKRVASAPPAAMMIDLAPLPAAPTPPSDQPPGPEQVEAKPPPEPEPEPEEELPEPPRVEKAEVPLPEPKPKPKPKPKPEPKREEPTPEPPNEKPPAPRTSAPPSADRQAPPAAPSTEGAGPSQARIAAEATWHDRLLARLQQYKRYPSRARMRRQEGVAYLRFVVDRHGNVVSAEIDRSSGSNILDRETLFLVRRAEPLPSPPKEVPGATIELVVPVEFSLH